MTDQPPAPARIWLSVRQITALRMIATGYPTEAIAAQHHVSVHAIKRDIKHLLAAFDARTRAHLVTRAFQHGWLTITRHNGYATLHVAQPSDTAPRPARDEPARR